MSQVIKKLQPGGTVEPLKMSDRWNEITDKFEAVKHNFDLNKTKQPSNLGSITIGGTRYEATPELIESLTSHLSGYGESAAPLAGLASALQNGAHITYDPIGNNLTGWGDFDGGGASTWRRNWDATLNNDAHKRRQALKLLGLFSYKPKDASADETKVDPRKIYSNNIYYKFDKDNNLLENDNDTLQVDQRLKDWTDYLYGTDEDRKNFDISGYDAARVAALRTLAGKYDPTKWNTEVEAIKARAKAGNLQDADIAFLKNFNIVKPDATPEEVASAAEKASRERFKNAGWDYDKWSPYIEWNDEANDWRVSAAGQGALKAQFGQVGNYDFNDAFLSSEYNPYGNFDFLGGHVIIGDRIYKASDVGENSDLTKWLSRKGGVRELNAAMRLEDANRQMEQLWGQTPNWTRGDNKHYMNWVNPNGNRFYRGVTGSYDWERSNPDATQLAQYVDIDPTKADAFGRYTPQYMETDAYGNALTFDENGNAVAYTGSPIAKANRDQNAAFYSRELMYSDNPYSVLNGRYLVGDSVDPEGNVTGLGVWIDPNNPNDWIVQADYTRYIKALKGKGIKLDPKMAQILSKYKGVMNTLQNNPVLREKFIKTLATKVASQWNLNGATDSLFSNPMLTDDWKALGITDENDIRELNEIVKRETERNRLFRTSKHQRRAKWVVDIPQLHKHGGKIQKHDIGQLLGAADENKSAATQTKLDKPIRDTKKFHQIGTDDPWQAHDTLELGALVGDLASLGISLGAGWNPVGSVAAGVTGIAGSTAGFAADVKRDGFQGSDLGNYAINLGLDALAFIPVAGEASKIAKVGRLLTKHAKTVKKAMTAAAAAGIISAGDAAYKKVQSGENLDIRDIRTIANALGGVAHMYRAGIKGLPKRGAGEIQLPNIKAKPGKEAAAFDLPESTFGAISKAKDSNEVAEIIAKELNKSVAEGGTKWTKESVIDTYDLSSIVKNRKRFLLFGKNIERIVDLSAKMKKGKLDWDGREVIGGDKARQRSADYNAMLEGKQRVKEQVKGERPWNEVMPDRQYFRDPYFVEANATQAAPQEIDPTFVREFYRRIPRRTPITSGFIFSPYSEDRTLGWKQYNTEQPIEAAIAPEAPTGYNYVWRPVMQPRFKKGGKIVKGQFSLNTSLLDKSLLGGGFTNKGFTVPTVGTTSATGTTNTSSSGYANSSLPSVAKYWKAKQSTLPSITEANDWLNAQKSADEVVTSAGTEADVKLKPNQPGSAMNFDFNPSINAARALWAMGQSDKQLKNFLNRPLYQMQAPLLNAPRFQSSGAGDEYRVMANALRMSKPVSSDAVINEAMQRKAQQAALNLEQQAVLQDSKEFGQYLHNLGEFNQQNILRNTEIANQNALYRNQYETENILQKNANIAQKSAIVDAFGNSMQDWLTKQHDTNNLVRNSEDYNAKLGELSNWYANALSDIETRFKDNPDGQAEALRNLRLQLQMRQQALSLIPAKNQQLTGFKWLKSGGKVGKDSKVTYSRNPYPELLLQNNKNTARYVEKLSDAVLKMILQTKPTHVS